jgi:hypothetical protein
MNVALHIFLQALALVMQYGNLAFNVVPAKYKPVVTLIISGAQGGLAWYNHYYTPAGVPISPAA